MISSETLKKITMDEFALSPQIDGKNSVGNLQYGPKTRLIRGINNNDNDDDSDDDDDDDDDTDIDSDIDIDTDIGIDIDIDN